MYEGDYEEDSDDGSVIQEANEGDECEEKI